MKVTETKNYGLDQLKLARSDDIPVFPGVSLQQLQQTLFRAQANSVQKLKKQIDRSLGWLV